MKISLKRINFNGITGTVSSSGETLYSVKEFYGQTG